MSLFLIPLKRKSIVFSVIIIFVVFKLFLSLVFKSTYVENKSNSYKILKLYKQLIYNLNEKSKLHESRYYRILYGNNDDIFPLSFDVTLVSQCSSNHLFEIIDLLKAWEGPISVAVLSDLDNVYRTLWDMAKLKVCYNNNNLAIHLVIPREDANYGKFKYSSGVKFTNSNSFSCDVFESSIVNSKKNYNWSYPYPANLLRNIAKLRSSSEYIFVVDIDMIPSVNLRTDFLNFASKNHVNHFKELFVVPVFESQIGVRVPRDKNELIEKVNVNQARPFYFVPCRNCQRLTKYGEWLMFGGNSGTEVLYEVEWKHPWEPFFIAKRHIADFDVRFTQYGLNRISQICELHVAGYKFLVLDNVFIVHKGYKTLEDFHKTKEDEMKANKLLYNQFKIDITFKYPNSERRC